MRKIPVLVIDDTEVNLLIFNEVLSGLEDIEIFDAKSGPEAIQLAEANSFGLIISDVNMPVMNGFETIERIRKIDCYENISVIFISAMLYEAEDMIKGYNTGAVDYIAKPFNHEILLSKVSIHLKLYRQKIQLEEQFRELSSSKNFIESITSSIQEAIVLTNETGQIRYWNNSAQKLFGYTSDEVQAMDISSLVVKDKLKPIIDQIFTQKIHPSSTDIFELDMVDKSKNSFPVELTISEFDNQETTSYVFVIREITSKKAQEEYKLKAKEFKEANRIMSDFIDNMNHELRTPLNQIIGISSIILKYERDKLEDEQLEAISRIADEGGKLLSIVDKVLQFREISPLKLELSASSLCIDHINKTARKFYTKKDINYSIVVDENLPEQIMIDLDKYKMSLEQIMLNAIKFTDRGEINIHLFSSETNFIIEITDSGIGMTEQQRENIFREFYQVKSSSDRTYSGLGMGLALAEKYIKQMYGKIEVESKAGEGSIFRIYIPLING